MCVIQRDYRACAGHLGDLGHSGPVAIATGMQHEDRSCLKPHRAMSGQAFAAEAPDGLGRLIHRLQVDDGVPAVGKADADRHTFNVSAAGHRAALHGGISQVKAGTQRVCLRIVAPMVIDWVHDQLDEAIDDAVGVVEDLDVGLDFLLDVRPEAGVTLSALDELLYGGARLRSLARTVAADAEQVRDELLAVCDAAEDPWDGDTDEVTELAERAGTAGLAAGVLVERTYQLLAARRMWRDGVDLLAARQLARAEA